MSTENIEAKRFSLSVTTYGIHALYRKKLEEIIMNEFDTRSIFIYEYLLDSPVVKGSKLEEDQSPLTFAPFLRRILNELTFTPIYDKGIKSSRDVKFSPQTFDKIVDFWIEDEVGASVELRETTICNQVFKCWGEPSQKVSAPKSTPVVSEANQNVSSDNKLELKFIETSQDGLIIGNWQCNIQYLREKYLEEFTKLGSKAKNCLLKEYFTVVYPWTLLAKEEKLNIGAISLSTDNLFYGVILVFYPETKGMDPERGIFSKPRNGNSERGDSQFLLELRSIIVNRYLPVLLLHENLWKENEISDLFKKYTDKDSISDTNLGKLKAALLAGVLTDSDSNSKCIFLSENLKKSNNGMESSLEELWVERKKLTAKDDITELKDSLSLLKDSLIFSKYSIASLGMINEIKKIMVKRIPKKDNDYLPSVLVIGSPGSGKDNMARAISLFFPGYRFGKRYTLNMASIKPSSISVPLLSGAEVDFNGTANSTMKIDGIFKKIWEDYLSEIKANDKVGFLPVVILDELNSLDIDAQGALLRILENGKLQPLGGIKEEKVNFLVIGIVNEPEKVLTLHEPLQRFLTDNTVFGGVLGKVFYEYFRGMRRLREDIYFRMIREGKVELPNLAERRTDIPMMFKVFLEKELPDKTKLWIDYDVFDELMSESIPWNGNFRELQSLTKRIGQKAKVDPSNSKIMSNENSTEYFRVSRMHVMAALEEMKTIK